MSVVSCLKVMYNHAVNGWLKVALFSIYQHTDIACTGTLCTYIHTGESCRYYITLSVLAWP